MKNYVAVFVGALCICGSVLAYGGTMQAVPGKGVQKKAAKVDAPAAESLPMQKVDPRELIARDSVKALQKWLDAEKDYRAVREQIRQQDEQILLFKERQDKAGKVLELYKANETADPKESAQSSEHKDAEKSLRDAEKGYDAAMKDMEKLKEKLFAAEKRYNLAERAYKIYNPSLSGVSGIELRKSMGDTSAVSPGTK